MVASQPGGGVVLDQQHARQRRWSGQGLVSVFLCIRALVMLPAMLRPILTLLLSCASASSPAARTRAR